MSHQTISFIKSVIRLIGYTLLPVDIWMAAGILFISECVGVVEEVGH